MTTREVSKLNHTTTSQTEADTINLGSLQRIADAVEKMASSYDVIREERDWLKSQRDELRGQVDRQARTIRALKGVITKMKRRA